MSKRVLISVLFIISCMTALAQSNAITTSEDSTINVIAWFNKNDTTEYTYTKEVMTIQGTDTTRTNEIEHKFRVTVADSTAEGYRLSYETLSWKADNEMDSLKAGFQFFAEGDEPVVFTTNEYGQIQHMENWREVRKRALPGLLTFLDVMYKQRPGLDSIMPKRNFTSLIRLGLNSEDEVVQLFPNMKTLMELHGKSFNIGLTHKDSPDKGCGYPIEVTTLVTYEGNDSADSGSYDGDYLIRNSGAITFQPDDVKEIASSILGVLMSEDFANKADSAINDSLNVPLEMRVLSDYHYFYSGWPKLIRKQTIANLEGVMTKVTTETIEWERYRWNEYDKDDNDGTSTAL